MTKITDLHSDALIEIFHFFKLQELPTLLQVCKHWRNIIDSCNDIWRKFIPKCKVFIPPILKTSKQTLQNIRQKSFLVGEEMWYPDTYPQLVTRNDLIRFCDHWGYGMHRPDRTGFKMYTRLNPLYDFINDHKNEKLAPLINRIWENFDAGQPFAETSEENRAASREYNNHLIIVTLHDVIDQSQVEKYDPVYKEKIQEWFEPYYIRKNIDVERINLETLSMTEQYQDGDITHTDFVAVEPEEDNYIAFQVAANENLRKNYYQPTDAFYQKFIKTLFGPNGDKEARTFYLVDGSLNENFDYGRDITIGENTVFYNSQFYDL
ncbi:uncharacterized protein LOC130624210 [Hydractinia symbiolongicarpus]|uniref:uncharacterized protein LOC130624210 n=1 Tax=Hydractinia symbiolongicarpus TaxID=13093 RepID=UPI00254FE358|nr:uncharacterized protein LOC130624210 [Hydractinia symbiolongicarpus]